MLIFILCTLALLKYNPKILIAQKPAEKVTWTFPPTAPFDDCLAFRRSEIIKYNLLINT